MSLVSWSTVSLEFVLCSEVLVSFLRSFICWVRESILSISFMEICPEPLFAGLGYK